ncbi:PilZ domain-containing protein [Aureimonas leprariae]|uniref:PilZ domain-containing protein n=1 Tax=Plantimonas leprariae TaxID=2615207 RepID=A0A7V7PP49_9HYPH|nr:PilZ domain-containing protein [Aureimonas leprariae]KAB0679743.1 hypothetical protein F6X38_10965 [Aureimonas leprariae]
MEKRRAQRKTCNVNGRIITFDEAAVSHECRILDITCYGALIKVERDISIPRQFELMVGDSPLTYPSRLARVTSRGIGVEFLDPLREEIAAALLETLFRDELLLEKAYGVAARKSPVRQRVDGAVETLLDTVIQRGERTTTLRKLS